MSNIVKDQNIIWTGENPYIRLFHGESGEIVTSISLFRIVYSSKYGNGHALFLLSDLDADGFNPKDDYCICLTDNLVLANWLKEEIVIGYTGFRDMLSEYSAMPIIETKDFHSTGDPSQSWTETVKGEGIEIALSWKSLDSPFYAEIPSSDWPHTVCTVLQASRNVDVLIDGKKPLGHIKDEDFYGKPATSCCLAFSETWLSVK